MQDNFNIYIYKAAMPGFSQWTNWLVLNVLPYWRIVTHMLILMSKSANFLISISVELSSPALSIRMSDGMHFLMVLLNKSGQSKRQLKSTSVVLKKAMYKST